MLNFFNFLLPLGFPVGITKFIAQNNNLTSELINSVIKILLYPAISFLLIIYFFSDNISVLLFGNDLYAEYVKFTCLFIPFIMIYNIFEAYVKGIKNIDIYVKTLITSTIFTLLVSVPLTFFFNLYGALTGLLISYASFIFILIFFLKKNNLSIKIRLKTKINKKLILDISKISFAILLAGTIHQISIMILKRITIDKFGTEGNGLFQSVFNISIFYFGFIFTSLSSYSFPKISGLSDNSELNSELNNTIRFVLIILVPLISFLLIFRDYILVILYTKEFASAESLFKYQYTGDLFKALSWVLGLWLIPRSKIFLFIVLDIILNFNLIVIYSLLLNYSQFNLDSVSISYLFSYFIHFVLNFYFSKRLLMFSFTPILKKLFISSVIVLSSITVISLNINLAGYLLIVFLFSAWFFINIKKSDLISFRLLLNEYLKR